MNRLDHTLLALLRAALPDAERDEVLGDLRAELRARSATRGPAAARRWLLRQTAGALSWRVRRAWRGGWSGWEPEANRMRTGGAMLEGLILDLRHAARRLRRRPTYTALAVATLALGVGGTAAVYGLVRTVLVEPLPYASPGDLVRFWVPGDWSRAEYGALRADLPAELTGLAAYWESDVTYQPAGAPARLVEGVEATSTLFEVLGVAPLLGPGFQDGDDRPGAAPVVVLSHGLWRELGGDPALVGRTLVLGGIARTVVGVMPPGFWFPDPSIRAWLPTRLPPTNRGGLFALVGRMRDGTGEDARAAALSRITPILDEQFDYPAQWDKLASPALDPLQQALTAGVRSALLATLAAMGIILLIACANVAALMLGQVSERRTELAVRSALGAGRRRIVGQLGAEALVLGLAAGVAGALVAAAAFVILTRALPLGALAEQATLDWGTWGAALAIGTGAALAVALVPGLAQWRSGPGAGLAGARTSGIAGRGRLESGLVVAEVALAVMMAAGAALLLRSVHELRAIDPGIETEGIAVLDLVAGEEYDAGARKRLVGDLVREAGALPGVRTAAAIQKLPLRGSGDNWGIAVEGRPDAERSTTAFRIVTADYFEAIGQPLRAGRTFDASDADGETVVIINRTLAERYFPGEDPLGRRIGTGYDTTWATIIGVVEDAADGALTEGPAPSRYMLAPQLPLAPSVWALVLRTTPGQPPEAVAEAARSVVQSVAPGVAVQTATTMEAVFEGAMGQARQLLGLLLLLAGLAMALGAVGVYGVLSQFVHRRRRDWGIRMALGLRASHLVGRIVGRAGVLIALGVAAGLLASTAVLRILATFLYGVATTDPAAFAMATLAIVVVALTAALIPARRASAIDPATVLRDP